MSNVHELDLAVPPAAVMPVRVAFAGAGAPALVALIGSTVTISVVQVRPGLLAVPSMTDVLVLASRDPATDLNLLRRRVGRLPSVLAVTAAGPQVLATLRAGATSLLVSGQFAAADLIAAIQATARGESRLAPAALAVVLKHLREAPAVASAPQPPALSRREREIMEMIVAGESNRTIATRLGLAEKTVRNQVSRLYRKLAVRNRAQAARYWLRSTAAS